MDMLRRIGLPKKFLFALLVISLFFAGLELLCRFIISGYLEVTLPEGMIRTHLKSPGFVYDPDLFWVWKNLPDPYLGLSIQGFRGDDVVLKKPDGVFRIFALGDSATLGAGVRTEETYSAVLEDLLNKTAEGMRYEVINAGISGYGTLQIYRLLKKKVIYFQPDMIIVYSRPCDSPEDSSLDEPKPSGNGLSHRISSLLFKSKLYYCLRKAIEGAGTWLSKRDEKDTSHCPDGEEGNLGNIREFTARYGISLIIVEYPIMDLKTGALTSSAGIDDRTWEAPLVQAVRALRESGYPPSELFQDMTHPTPLGHRIIAQKIFQVIVEEKMIPSPPEEVPEEGVEPSRASLPTGF